MENRLVEVAAFLFLGYFAGTLYFIALISTCRSMYFKMKRQTVNGRVGILLASLFNPAPYMIALGSYGIYALIVGRLNHWFTLGFILPLFVTGILFLKRRKR